MGQKRHLLVSMVAGMLVALAALPAHANVPVTFVTDIAGDATAQNETPIAVNPLNHDNLITGANDWNYNDGCAVNASFDGGHTWTPTLPNGFLPGVTRFTNDPDVPGTGAYDVGGDPVIAFGPDGTAYYVCQAFNFTSPYQIALLVSRSSDGGRTWLDGRAQKLTQISRWNGKGKTKGSNGQFPDHESIAVDLGASSPYRGSVYVAWVQFNGGGTHSPVYVARSRDGARTFSAPVAITKAAIRNNQDARIAIAPDGTLYLTFDNGVQGNKGTVFYVSRSHDGGASWSAPVPFATMHEAVCLFPTYCFNIAGSPFRSGGTYPSPAYDASRGRLVVAWADIVAGRARMFSSSASSGDLRHWSAPVEIAPASGDRFAGELGAAPYGRLDLTFYDRSYSGNTLVDVTYAQSTDGGATWTSRRLSSSGFDPAAWGVPDGSGLRPFIGDYNGIVSLPERAISAWTSAGPTPGDPPNSNLDIFVGSIAP